MTQIVDHGTYLSITFGLTYDVRQSGITRGAYGLASVCPESIEHGWCPGVKSLGWFLLPVAGG